MEVKKLRVEGREAEGYVIPMGPFNIVCIKAGAGMIGCAAFDTACLDKFAYPAATISGVTTVEDLLEGEIKTANEHAAALGIAPGMKGAEAVALL